jgi:putative transposase
MPMKKHRPEQIVALLRQIEVEIANGKSPPQACKEGEITVQTYCRWRKEFGGLKLDQAKRMKELERENTKLKRLVAELSLEKQMGRGIGKLLSPEQRRCAVEQARKKYAVSERDACRLLGQW